MFVNLKTQEQMSAGGFRKAFTTYLGRIEGFEREGRPPTRAFIHGIETMFRDLEEHDDIRTYITGRATKGSSEVYGSFLEQAKNVLDRIPKLDL